MSQRIVSEAIEYERYVDGLRRSNAELVKVIRKAWKVIAADLGMIRSPATISLLSEMDALIAKAKDDAPVAEPTKTITIHVEGGLVQDVTGIPPGVEVRVEDYDAHDETGPTWDAEKECHVTVYGGGV